MNTGDWPKYLTNIMYTNKIIELTIKIHKQLLDVL